MGNMSNICSVTHCEPTQPQGHKGAFSKGLLNFTSIQGTGNSQLGEPEKSIAFLGWVKGVILFAGEQDSLKVQLLESV